MDKLTARQQQVLDVIKDHIDETGYPPTRAEIAKTLGFKSPNAAEEHIKALARKGHIEIVQGASRGIRLPESETGLPIIGRVAAGSPILATEQIAEYMDLPKSLFQPSADFLLQVQGLSMKDIGILEDDLIAVHKTNMAKNGDIVVARVGEDVTVKRYEKKGSVVTLHPENEDFSPIVVNLGQEDFEIEGLYVGVIRRSIH
ncbi:transcriptional repressor LexA [Reinekea marina]|uniref:LexA repressor n=1 Tax=Reinekea marina TaxID=1310421 RepID=A0ABV7WTK1_9GAMM|nr:transcriptional repressor LexA [Reinekea marina]MBU2865200.1 transcriptional repressor LexA [Reinekea forsetii]MDN3649703.1 transcriptional repressor LexA [Reinekea marina]